MIHHKGQQISFMSLILPSWPHFPCWQSKFSLQLLHSTLTPLGTVNIVTGEEFRQLRLKPKLRLYTARISTKTTRGDIQNLTKVPRCVSFYSHVVTRLEAPNYISNLQCTCKYKYHLPIKLLYRPISK